jgi:localization factor PodJL
MDPGQVVANVQSALQQQGYYQGDIDGVLGPQTRAALAEYQSAQGIEPTGAIDEPTLDTLGMS